MHVERGTVTITAGKDFVDVTYSEAFTSTPDLYVKPIDNLGGRDWWVSTESNTGFKIQISTPEPPVGPNHQFKYKAEGTAAITAGVTPDRVRDRVKLSATDIDDAKVTELILDAEATIEEETGLSIDCTDCTRAEGAAITNLAAIYCLVYISGGMASGLSYKIGELSVSESSTGPTLSGKAETLYREVERLISRLREPYVGRA